jgi:hypothetical protein
MAFAKKERRECPMASTGFNESCLCGRGWPLPIGLPVLGCPAVIKWDLPWKLRKAWPDIKLKNVLVWNGISKNLKSGFCP